MVPDGNPSAPITHLSGRPRRDEERLAHELVDGKGLHAVVLLQRPPPLRVQVDGPRVGPVVRPGVVQGVVRGVQLLAAVLVRHSAGGKWRRVNAVLRLHTNDLYFSTWVWEPRQKRDMSNIILEIT